MGFFSFMGRVLFASVFILSAWQIKYGLDFDFLFNYLPQLFEGIEACIKYHYYDIKLDTDHKLRDLVLRFNEFDANGGPIAKEFIPKLVSMKKNLSSKLGVGIPNIDVQQFIGTIIFLKGVGGILFVFGSALGSFLLLLHLALTAPLLYDFYNYKPNKPEYSLLLNNFMQSTALFGALLFFIGMKNSITRRQLKKKSPKAKTI